MAKKEKSVPKMRVRVKDFHALRELWVGGTFSVLIKRKTFALLGVSAIEVVCKQKGKCNKKKCARGDCMCMCEPVSARLYPLDHSKQSFTLRKVA